MMEILFQLENGTFIKLQHFFLHNTQNQIQSLLEGQKHSTLQS